MGTETLSGRPSTVKQRSTESALQGVSNRLSRFPSLSKRWKRKSAAGPKLSIITHHDFAASRTSSVNSLQLISPALSAISKHESHLPSSPLQMAFEDGASDYGAKAIEVDPIPTNVKEDQGQATTPLLPPMMTIGHCSDNSLVQSPLQSPTVAEAPIFPSSATPTTTPRVGMLPSPPLSAKPSLSSMQPRSGAPTMTVPTADIPPMKMLDDHDDEWSQRLGHANFNIHPEPYLPDESDIEAYRQLRANWDLARHNYGKHLARTGEHYGTTSKIYILTEEKWAAVDAQWKKYNQIMSSAVGPIIARLSDGDTDKSGSLASSAVLEKPLTRVIVPQIDDSTGKFPQMGDEDIIGPMAFAPARFHQVVIGPNAQARSPKKRNFLRFISDIFGRASPLRT